MSLKFPMSCSCLFLSHVALQWGSTAALWLFCKVEGNKCWDTGEHGLLVEWLQHIMRTSHDLGILGLRRPLKDFLENCAWICATHARVVSNASWWCKQQWMSQTSLQDWHPFSLPSIHLPYGRQCPWCQGMTASEGGAIQIQRHSTPFAQPVFHHSKKSSRNCSDDQYQRLGISQMTWW